MGLDMELEQNGMGQRMSCSLLESWRARHREEKLRMRGDVPGRGAACRVPTRKGCCVPSPHQEGVLHAEPAFHCARQGFKRHCTPAEEGGQLPGAPRCWMALLTWGQLRQTSWCELAWMLAQKIFTDLLCDLHHIHIYRSFFPHTTQFSPALRIIHSS